jgi:GLPGLI family protein
MTDVIEMLGKTYIVEDSLKLPEWKILNDLKEVAGHICMKAQVEDLSKIRRLQHGLHKISFSSRT